MGSKGLLELNRKLHYHIIYISNSKEELLAEFMKRHLEEGQGTAFVPRMEYYRRGDKAVKIREMFKGYVFVYSCLDIRELHFLIRSYRREINAGMRELAFRERTSGDPNYPYRETEETIYELSDINPEEERFLDTLREGDGLLGMSSGYRDGTRIVVMEGPLKDYEDCIDCVDTHNRKAFLAFTLNGRQAQAGFNCRPKTDWFPLQDPNRVALEDGTEVDLETLKKKIMSN